MAAPAAPAVKINPDTEKITALNTAAGSLIDIKKTLLEGYNAIKTTTTNALSSIAGHSASNSYGTPPTASQSDVMQGLSKIAIYLLGIIIILVILSLAVHYFITPIYNVRPGDPGIITIPWLDDGVLFWNGSGTYPVAGPILNSDLPIVGSYYDYTFIVDLFIQNPMKFSTHPRILLSRGLVRSSTPSGDTITGIAKSYNFLIALAPTTNDLIVSVLNTQNQSEDIIIENVPVQTSFRIGVSVGQRAMEVYINGQLLKTRKYNADLKDIKGNIAIADTTENTIAVLKNFKIWDTILSSPQIAHAKPSIADNSSFNFMPIPTTTSCSS